MRPHQKNAYAENSSMPNRDIPPIGTEVLDRRHGGSVTAARLLRPAYSCPNFWGAVAAGSFPRIGRPGRVNARAGKVPRCAVKSWDGSTWPGAAFHVLGTRGTGTPGVWVRGLARATGTTTTGCARGHRAGRDRDGGPSAMGAHAASANPVKGRTTRAAAADWSDGHDFLVPCR